MNNKTTEIQKTYNKKKNTKNCELQQLNKQDTSDQTKGHF